MLVVLATASLNACTAGGEAVIIDGAFEARAGAEEAASAALDDLRKTMGAALNSGGVESVTALSTTRWNDQFVAQDIEAFAPNSDALGTVYDYETAGQSFSASGALRATGTAEGAIDFVPVDVDIVVCFRVSGSYDGIDFSEAPCPEHVEPWLLQQFEPGEVVPITSLDLDLEDRSLVPRTPLPSPTPRAPCSGSDCPGG